MKRALLIVAISLSSFVPCPVFSQERGSVEDDNGTAGDGTVTSIEAFNAGSAGSGVYARSAEYNLQQGNIDKAIKLCQQALEIKNDPDLHQIYATALQRKLEAEDEKDPTLYRKCVGQWLMVLRQSGGEENLAFHGASLPGVGKFWEDEDRSMPAKQEILKLTGHLPKVWETNEKFLNRVTRDSKTSVSGDIVHATHESKNNLSDIKSSKHHKLEAEDQ